MCINLFISIFFSSEGKLVVAHRDCKVEFPANKNTDAKKVDKGNSIC